MKFLLKTAYKSAGQTCFLSGEGKSVQDSRVKIQLENNNGIITGDIIPKEEIEITEFSVSFKRSM